MKKILWILIGLIAAGIAVFFIYKWWYPQETENPLNLIPENSVMTVESSSVQEAITEIKNAKSWENFSSLSAIADLQNKILFLDSLIPQENRTNFLKDKKCIISFHAVTSNSLDCIFFIPVTSSERSEIEDLVSQVSSKNGYVIQERKFNDQKIYSLTSSKKKIGLYYLNYKNLFITSFSETLIEDVIRHIESNSAKLQSKEEVKSDHKVILNLKYKMLPYLLSVFTENPVQDFDFVKYFGENTSLEVNFSEKAILMNGFTHANQSHFIELFKNQQPQQFNLKNYIPNQASTVYYYGIDKCAEFGRSLNEFWKKNDKDLMHEMDETNLLYDIHLKDLYDDIGKEIGICSISDDSLGNGKLFFLRSEDAERLFLHLSKIVTLVSSVRKESVKTETIKGIKIKEMSIPEFPRKLFGRGFSGFPKSWFAVIDDYVVFSNNVENIKNLLKDIDEENVWGKTLKITTALEEGITEFNVGLFVNLSNVKNNDLKLREDSLNNNSSLMRKFELVGFQFSHVQPSIFSQVILTSNDIDTKEEISNKKAVFDQEINSPLFLVDNKRSGKDILFQDKNFNVYLMSAGGKITWKKEIADSIISNVYTVDLNKDRIYDFVFATKSKIYAFDYKGNLLPKFPFAWDLNSEIKNLILLDYNSSGDYRIVADDTSGNICFFNIKGEKLEGWNPKKMKGPLSERVKHLRIGNKDLVLVIQQKGIVNIFNRRGEVLENFPVDLGSEITGNCILEKGNTLENSELVFILKDEILKINLLGKVKSREPSGNFHIADSKGLSYLLYKKGAGSASICDQQKVRLFEVKNLSTDYIFKYETFSNAEFILIHDRQNKKLYVYNRKGTLLLDEAIDSEYHSSPFFDEKSKAYYLYNFSNKEVRPVKLSGL